MAIPINVSQIPTFDPHTEPSTTTERWHKWLRSFERVASAAGSSNGGQKRNLLLHTAGEAVQDIFDTLANTGTTYTQAKTQFTPKANAPFNKHVFHRAEQRQGETVAQFVNRLRQFAVSCEYGDNVDEYTRDQLIDKCRSDQFRIKLLAEGKDLTLDRTLEVAQTRESS